jgi:hypothetical protein
MRLIAGEVDIMGQRASVGEGDEVINTVSIGILYYL